MSYATLTHMRSTRYPMSGVGCIDGPPGTRSMGDGDGLGCGCGGRCGGAGSVGQVTLTADTGTVFGVSALGLVAGGLGLWWLLRPHRARTTTPNRRVRRNRRSRR